MKRLDLAIESDLGNVSLVAVAVNRICVQLGLDDIVAGQVELCIAEAATNAIRHAYHDQPGHTVGIKLAAGAEKLQIEVSDSGTPMPPEQQHRLLGGAQVFEVPTRDRHSIPEGGRGLQIIRELMDDVSYVRGGDLNRLIMTKQLASPGRC